jgi:hypothetical protein
MRTRTFILLAVAVFAVLVGGFLYVALGDSDERRVGALRTYSSGNIAMSINGTHAGYLKSMSCGVIGAEAQRVEQESTGTDPKQLGNATPEPCEIAFGLPEKGPLPTWIVDAVAGKNAPHNVALVSYSYDFKEVSRLELSGALLTEFSLPPFDAASKDQVTMTITLKPEAISYVKGSGATAPPKTATKAASAFRFNLAGSPVTKVSKVSAWSFQWNAAAQRSYLGDFTITVAANDPRITDLDKMLQNFVVAGENGPGAETTGSIEILDSTLVNVLATVEFTGVGMKEGSYSGFVDADSIAKREYSFYVEGFNLKLAG